MIIHLTDVCKACSRKAFWFLSQSRIMQHKCWSIYLIPDLCLSGIFFIGLVSITDCHDPLYVIVSQNTETAESLYHDHIIFCAKSITIVFRCLLLHSSPWKGKKIYTLVQQLNSVLLFLFHQQTHMLKLLMNELLSTMQEDKAGVLPGNSTVGS